MQTRMSTQAIINTRRYMQQKENEKHIIHSTFQFVQCLNKSFNSYENNLMTQADCNNIIPRYMENDPHSPGIIPPFELYDVIRKTTHFANQNVQIIIKNMNPKKRPVSAVADNVEVRNATYISIKINKKIRFNLLYDSNRSLQKKIKIEQIRNETN